MNELWRAVSRWRFKLEKTALSVLMRRAQAQEAGGDHVGALDTLRRATAEYPENPSPHIKLAVLAANGGQTELAETALQAAIFAAEKPPAWWYARLASIQVGRGDRIQAAHNYRTALRHLPGQASWSAALRELERNPHLNEASTSFYNDLYAASDSYRAPPDISPYLPLWERIVEVAIATRCERVLDVGCGPGQFGEYLLSKCRIDYTGFDFSHTAIEQAKQRGLEATFHCDNLFSTDLFSSDYDTIICTEVLEHIEHDRLALSRFRSGSYALCSVPSFHAFGHLRTFRDADEVRKRYEGCFENMEVEKIPISDADSIFLLHGVISSSEVPIS